MQAIAIHLTRHDEAVSFDDTVPEDWSIERLTDAAVPRLRLPTRDVASNKPLRYAALHEGSELPRMAKVGTAVRPGGRVVIGPEYANARV